jgi:16S rRNA processing protein RimM
MAERVRVARIGAAHGIRGEVRLWPFTQDPMDVASYGELETEDSARRFIIKALRPAKDFLVARFVGVSDRDTAETLTNLELYVPRERLPNIEDADTYYHADLVGLAAVTVEGVTLGIVTAIHNFGAGDIIEITPESGTPLMLTFTEAAVPKVDLDARQIVVVPPPDTE